MMTADLTTHFTLIAQPQAAAEATHVRGFTGKATWQPGGASARVRSGLNDGGIDVLLARCAR